MKSNNTETVVAGLLGLAGGYMLAPKNSDPNKVNGYALGALSNANKRIEIIKSAVKEGMVNDSYVRHTVKAFCIMSDEEVSIAYTYIFIYKAKWATTPESFRKKLSLIAYKYEIFS